GSSSQLAAPLHCFGSAEDDGGLRLIQDCKNGNEPRGVLSLEDKARPHTARDTKEHIRRLGWEGLDHQGYKPDLVPSDFHLFPALNFAGYRDVTSEAMKRCGKL
ncbi:hypothetical protein AVEN_65820-1, partial [Araneus ventricosus]